MDDLSTRIRHGIVTLWCKLLRHPAPTVEYASGMSWMRCPCGRIEVSVRPFATQGGRRG